TRRQCSIDCHRTPIVLEGWAFRKVTINILDVQPESVPGMFDRKLDGANLLSGPTQPEIASYRISHPLPPARSRPPAPLAIIQIHGSPCPAVASPSSPRAPGRLLISRSIRIQKGRPPRFRRAFYLFSKMNLDYSKSGGLVTAVVQDHASGRVLMV